MLVYTYISVGELFMIFTVAGHKLISGASSVMDMSRTFTSSLMMTSSGSHGSLNRSTLGSSLSDVHSPPAVQDESKLPFSKVCFYSYHVLLTLTCSSSATVIYKNDSRH